MINMFTSNYVVTSNCDLSGLQPPILTQKNFFLFQNYLAPALTNNYIQKNQSGIFRY